MSRHNSKQRDGVTLPFALRKELGLPDASNDRDVRRRSRGSGNRVADRKQQRLASRVEKKSNDLRPRGRQENTRQISRNHENGPNDFESDEDTVEEEKERPKPVVQTNPKTTKYTRSATVPPPKSILKKKKAQISLPGESNTDSDEARSSSPGLILDASSKAFRDRAAQDDAEIVALEKRLGMKKKKSSTMGDEMLDYLLEGLDDEGDSKKRKRDGKDWLESKRRKTEELEDESEEGSGEDSDMGELDGLDGFEDEDVSDEDEDSISDPEQVMIEIDSDDEESQDEVDEDMLDDSQDEEADGAGDFSGFESEDQTHEPAVVKVRENPYVAPVAPGTDTAKYIPPSLRKRDQNGNESLERLKRQVQGHLNKLSEANMISILGEIEKLYRTNPRQDVTTALNDLLLFTFSNPSSLQNTFIILHAAFVAAVYKVMGIDFGAELLVKIVEQFDEKYKSASTGKEALNLISLLANLFTFGVVSSNIIYDHIRLLLSDFSESNAELLLRVVRDCGPQLRSDDPSALKGIIQMMHDISTDLTNKGQQLNIRTRVMMDAITDLKNNKMKNATNAAGMTGEHITRMRKALGSLNSRSLKATEPLRITRADISNSDKKGKWWLVGASWKGNELQSSTPQQETQPTSSTQEDSGDDEVDFLALSKQYRMNTSVRRSIFTAIMSASDGVDAQTRLLKLRLSSKQDQEIARVLLRCARAEPAFNPYYALLARNLCKENRKIRMGFQFGLWDFFTRMGEKSTDTVADDEDDEDEDQDEQPIDLHEIVNLAKLFAYLISRDHLSLSILKVLNIGFLKPQTTMFLEVLLVSIMTQPNVEEDALLKVFGRTAAETPHLVKGLRYFIKRNVKRSDLLEGNKKEKRMVKKGCEVAGVAFGVMLSAGEGDGEVGRRD